MQLKCTWFSVSPTLWYHCWRIVVPGLPASKSICSAIRTRMATIGDGVVQSRNFGWQPVPELTCDQMRCPGFKWLLFFPKLNSWKDTKFSDNEDVICTASGWLEDQEQQFIYNGITALEKCWTIRISVAGVYVKKWQIWCAYLVVNCVILYELFKRPSYCNKHTPCFRKKTSTHIIGYKLRNSCQILIIFDTKIPRIIWNHITA